MKCTAKRNKKDDKEHKPTESQSEKTGTNEEGDEKKEEESIKPNKESGSRSSLHF
jgi:hypothetical protein